ncbi:MAG: flippase-like domain-containing protein [bacterium]|nr:flippase-like domain-containing protein [bacterium]
MKLPRNLTRKTFAVAGVAAIVYVGAGLAIGWEEFAGAVSTAGAGPFALAAGLSLVNYGLRFLRWHDFLGTLGCRPPLASSARIYFATYVMVITPGKVGEVFKAGMLRDLHQIPLSRGLPAVFAERIYDFLAVLGLVALGMLFWDAPFRGAPWGLAAGAGFVALLLVVRSSWVRRRLVEKMARSKHLAGHTVGMDDALLATQQLLSPVRGSAQLLLSIAAWFCECAGMWVVCRALAPGVDLGGAVFIYGAATLIGSLSFLPGGLGGTEAVIVALLRSVGVGVAAGGAVAFIVRLATLWLAVVLGVIVFLFARRHLLPVAEVSTGSVADRS